MSIYSNRVTVGTAATLLVPASNMAQKAVLLNAGTTIVRIGNEEVSSTNAWGLPIIPDTPNATRNYFATDVEPGDSIWGITASGTSTVNIWAVRKS